jgi:hypothetical protein
MLTSGAGLSVIPPTREGEGWSLRPAGAKLAITHLKNEKIQAEGLGCVSSGRVLA